MSYPMEYATLLEWIEQDEWLALHHKEMEPIEAYAYISLRMKGTPAPHPDAKWNKQTGCIEP